MNSKKVTVYCASSDKVDEQFLLSAEKLGNLLASEGYQIIYGGGKVGLMGRLANGALSQKGKITGVIPEFMIGLELAHERLSELRIVKDMHSRQATMLYESDLIITLPGGSGSMLEFFEAISWKRLGLISSPIILVNLFDYYAPMIQMLEHSIEEKFMEHSYCDLWHVTSSIEETIDLVKSILK
jgi:uncharacterized protein (TIGR00730 family)